VSEIRDPNYVPTLAEALGDPAGFVAGMTETSATHTELPPIPAPPTAFGDLSLDDLVGLERERRRSAIDCDNRAYQRGTQGDDVGRAYWDALARGHRGAAAVLSAALGPQGSDAERYPDPGSHP
jgi:hypothetical protein